MPLLFGIGMDFHCKYTVTQVVQQLARCGFSISLDEGTRYLLSVMTSFVGRNPKGVESSQFTHFVADNVDNNIRTVDSHEVFHGMGIISVSAVITETHFKQKHTDSVIGIDNYTVFRQDRAGRRGGGVALYVNSSIQWSVWSPSLLDNRAFELLWVRVGVTLFVAALYHPPRPIYCTDDLLRYVENCVAEITHDYPQAEIVLAGDLNQLQDDDIVERTGLTQIVHQPTRGTNVLDQVFVSDPQLYGTVRVVSSVVKSDHKAVVVMSNGTFMPNAKTKQQCKIRPKTPSQNASFLQHLLEIDLGTRPDVDQLTSMSDPQAFYDEFYAFLLGLLEEYYPERTT